MKQIPAKINRKLFRGQQKSVWDFYRDGVSSSIISGFLACREQSRLQLVEGWRSRVTPFYFAYGTCVHWIFRQAYAQETLPSKALIKRWLNKYFALWEKDVPVSTTAQREQQETVCAYALAQLPYYFRRWAGDFTGHNYPVPTSTVAPKGWVALEQRFETSVRLPDGVDVKVFGTQDGILWTDHRTSSVPGKKAYWDFDTKCRSYINEDETVETLPMDLQQMLYLWATKKRGFKPSGVVLNVLRRPGQRRRQEESLKDFAARIEADCADPEKWSHYFYRFQMHVTMKEIDDWERNLLIPILQDIKAWWDGTAPHYMNPNALVSKYGQCEMYNPIVRNNYATCYQRTNVTDYQEFLG